MPGMTLVPGHRLTFSKAKVSLRDITATLITHSCRLGAWSQMLAMAVLIALVGQQGCWSPLM